MVSLSKYIVANPRRSILWPSSIAFVLAYPFLYMLVSRLSLVFSARPDRGIIYIKQALILAQDSILENHDYHQCLRPLLDLSSNDPFTEPFITTDNDVFNDLLTNSTTSFLHLPTLFLDTNYSSSSSLLSLDISTPGLELLNIDHNNYKQYMLIYLYKDKDDGLAWDTIIADHKAFNGNTNGDISLEDSWLLDKRPTTPLKTAFTYKKNVLSAIMSCVLSIYSVIALYMALSFMNVSPIRSVIGFSIAYLVELCLATGVAGTVVSLVYHIKTPQLDHFLLVAIRVLSISLENTQNLLTAIAKTPDEHMSLARVSTAADKTERKARSKVVITCAVLSLAFLPCCGSNDYLKSLSLFCIIYILTDFTLHVTYLTAVLSVDLRRFELEDLINSDLDLGNPVRSSSLSLVKDRPTAITTGYHQNLGGLLDAPPNTPYNVWNTRFKSFFFFKHLYWKAAPRGFFTAATMLYLFTTTPGNQESSLSGVMSMFLAGNAAHYGALYKKLLYVIADRLSSKLFIQETSLLVLDLTTKSFQSYPLLSKTFDLLYRLSPKNITLVSLVELISCLSFLLSLTGILMNFLLPKSSKDLDNCIDSNGASSERVSCKDMIGVHSLDVVKIITNGHWFATMSLDHKVCVWKAPVGSDSVSNVMEVPLANDFWPLTRIVLNGRHHMIALFSAKKATIKCWNFGKSYLNYYFTHPDLTAENPVMEAFFSTKDLVVILKNGIILIINDKGDSKSYDMFERIKNQAKVRWKVANSDSEADQSEPTAPKKLAFACRMKPANSNEVCLCITETNELIVAVNVRRQWRFRLTLMLESVWAIKGLGEEVSGTVAPRNVDDYFAHDVISRSKNQMFMPSSSRRLVLKQKITTIVPIHALNMVLMTSGLTASLLDVNSGTVLRHFRLGNYRRGSLKVIHSQPIHCRFCGCTSLESISVCYADADDEELVIEHTLRSQSLAKSTICLRVERDPRETRCRGFEATTEEQHWITNVEGWEATDMNMLLGIRRKESSLAVSDDYSGSGAASNVVDSYPQFNHPDMKTFVLGFARNLVKLSQKLLEIMMIQDIIGDQTYNSSSSCSSNSNCGPTPLISSTWEAWAMSAQGRVTCYDIPEARSPAGRGKPPRLLIQSIGPTAKYGHKSIVVAFGNLIKLLYIGQEESLIETDNDVGSVFSGSFAPSVTKRRPRSLASRNGSFSSASPLAAM